MYPHPSHKLYIMVSPERTKSIDQTLIEGCAETIEYQARSHYTCLHRGRGDVEELYLVKGEGVVSSQFWCVGGCETAHVNTS